MVRKHSLMLKIINDYIYKREGLKRIKYDESAWLQQLIISKHNTWHHLEHAKIIKKQSTYIVYSSWLYQNTIDDIILSMRNNKKNNQVWFKRFYLSNRRSVDCIYNNIFGASIVLYASILLYYIADVSIIQNGLGVL